MSNDVDEFLEAIETHVEEAAQHVKSRAVVDGEDAPTMPKTKEERQPGMPSQYALFGPGYLPTTTTVSHLPNGCYDIAVTQQGVIAVPSIKPSGLLLELPEMRSEHVIKLVDSFWDSEKDYKDGNEFVRGGAAYKAGILLFGEPGTGKSCTIKIVTKKLIERGGIVFNANINPNFISAFLKDFSQIEENRKIIVILEDIDSLIRGFGESKYLDMLDSAESVNNVMFIATTNYPERLDPRIYNRPGRLSHVVKIGLPTPEARSAYLKVILKNHQDIPEIVKATDNFSIDHLSALCNSVYREKRELKPELKRLRELFKVPLIKETKPIGFGFKE